MRHPVPALAAAAVAALAPTAPAHADALAAARGRARPVVVLSDGPGDPRAAQQLHALDGAGRALGERDIRVLTEAEPNGPLRRALGVAGRGFAVVLVGKDGTVKEVWHAPVAPKAIFALIDAMPMRREEMKR